MLTGLIQEDGMKTRIDYNYAHFDFEWSWIKDKQIIHKGNQYAGMLIILDSKGRAVGMYAYELISDYDKEQI
jgi:hypothetical protein